MQVLRINKAFHHGSERLLWGAAVLCFCILGVSGALAVQSQRRSLLIAAVPVPNTPAVVQRATQPGDVIGRLQIQAIGLSVPITAGIEANALLRGVGHVEGTAFPGGLGTLGLAGHRDTYFRTLRQIEVGMDIRVSDHSGTYHYKVTSTEVVMPEDVHVLAIRNHPELTLVTCYPFDYIGPAPQRFIVHASLQSASPDLVP